MALNLGPHTTRIHEIAAQADALPEGTRQQMIQADHARMRAMRANPEFKAMHALVTGYTTTALDRFTAREEREFWDAYGALHVHETVLGLMIHDTAPQWAYDYCTALWRSYVGPVLPSDAPWPATAPVNLVTSYRSPLNA